MAASGKRNYPMAAEVAAEIVLQKLEILLSRPEWVRCLANEALLNARKNLAKIRKFFSAQDMPSQGTEWTGRLLRALYDAEEFIDKFYLEVARGRQEALHVATRPLVALVHKFMLWRDLSNLVKSLEELCQNQYLEGTTEADEGREDEPASFAQWEGKKLARLTNFWDQQASTDFVCHETEKQEITKRIEESTDVHGTSILGEQGTGKTFLARRVYREAMNLGFYSHAWVHVSACTDKKEFLFKILKQLDKLARDSMDCNEIKKMLRWKLAKTFLIVLDDVQLPDQQLLQELLKIIPFPSKGHIITTTQDDTIARIMNTAEIVELKDLGSEESEKKSEKKREKMLATKLRGVREDSTLNPEEEKILNRFPAVPLCVSLLGGLLSYPVKQEHPALANDGAKLSVPDVLQLSYHRLPVHLKPCFIYMVLFPLASPISTRRLVRLWLAEGLLDSYCCNRELKRTPEDLGETLILELADRKVIDVVSWRADGSPKACQMLTSLYDLICPTTMSTGFLYVHKASKLRGGNEGNPTGQQQQRLDTLRGGTKVRWLAEHTNIVRDGFGHSYPDLNLGQVCSFLSFCPRRGMLTKDISTFLRNTTSKVDCTLLRVLDLEGVYKPSLQGVLRRLVLLRYLGLRSTVLDSIPSEVAHLHYLETLDMKHTNISSLPSPLWKKRNLRHLHLNWFYIDLMEILKACSNNVMALTQLQTLSGLIIGEVKENMMRDHTHSLTTLTTLKLLLQLSVGDSSGVSGKAVADWISLGLTNLQSLTFGVIQVAEPAKEAGAVEETTIGKETTKEAQSSKGATKVEEVKPAATSQIGPLPELSLRQHHKLLELYLLGQLKEPIIWTQLLPGSLRVLTLSGSMVKTDMMLQLGDLLTYLRTFRLLANSFQGPSLRFVKDGFPSLLVLKIWKLPRLEQVIIEQGAMPRLKELDLRHLDAMENVVMKEDSKSAFEGINECKELETIRVVVKKGATGFDHLKKRKGEMRKLYKRVETEKPEFIEDDDSHDYDNDYEYVYEDTSNDHEDKGKSKHAST